MAEETVTCLIEISKGTRNKYEFDPKLGALRLDRVLPASVSYPTDYGFVPETLAPDGDPLDVLLCVTEPVLPGCYVDGRMIALFCMEDEKGRDDHIVCVPVDDPQWDEVRDVDDLPKHMRVEISHFFSIYKDVDENRFSRVIGWEDRAAGLRALAECRARHAAGS